MSVTKVPLREIARPVQRPVEVRPGERYRTLGVKWWGEGVYERETIDGAQTAAKTLSVVSTDDLIINKIWVRHGSVAVVPPAIAGCAGSGEFPTFELNRERVEPRWLHWLTKTKTFWSACDQLSQGTSGKNRIRPDAFLTIEVPLPPIEEQRRIVARVEAIAAKLAEAQRLRHDACAETELVDAAAATEWFRAFTSVPRQLIRLLGPQGTNPIQTGPFGAQLHSSEFVDEGVPVLNVGNVWPTGLRLDKLDRVSPEKAAQLSRYSLEVDDVLFARSGATLGKVCLVPSQCDGWLMTGHLFRVRLDKSRCLSEFAFVCLASVRDIRDQVFGQVRGATRPGFNTTLLGNVEIPLPTIGEQARAVAELATVRRKTEALKRSQSEVAAELRAGLPTVLDLAFRGEL